MSCISIDIEAGLVAGNGKASLLFKLVKKSPLKIVHYRSATADIVLLDVNMPKKDEVTACKHFM
ncbi:hypothetical protein [Thalassotalea ganghwensis]